MTHVIRGDGGMMVKVAMLAVALGAIAAPASAQDVNPCAANLVCATRPASVLSEIKATEPGAKLTEDENGRPTIEVDGPTYKYLIMFMDCEANAKCAALTFSVYFEAEKFINADLANRWNLNHRVPKAFVNKKGELFLQMEVSTVGGLTRENFRDWKKWWDSSMSEFSDFYDKESADRDPKNRT